MIFKAYHPVLFYGSIITIGKIKEYAEIGAGVISILDGSLAIFSGAGKMWLGSSAGFGSDAATIKSFNNLVPKKGWFDVVVHGDNLSPGVLLNIDGTPLNAQKLYELMKEAGYQQGTKIRLISCNAAQGGKSSVAQELADLTNSQVIAPEARTLVDRAGKLITEDNTKYKVFNPTNVH